MTDLVEQSILVGLSVGGDRNLLQVNDHCHVLVVGTVWE